MGNLTENVGELARAHNGTAGRVDALIVDVRSLMSDTRQAKAELKLAHGRVLELERNAVAPGKRAGTARRG